MYCTRKAPKIAKERRRKKKTQWMNSEVRIGNERNQSNSSQFQEPEETSSHQRFTLCILFICRVTPPPPAENTLYKYEWSCINQQVIRPPFVRRIHSEDSGPSAWRYSQEVGGDAKSSIMPPEWHTFSCEVLTTLLRKWKISIYSTQDEVIHNCEVSKLLNRKLW